MPEEERKFQSHFGLILTFTEAAEELLEKQFQSHFGLILTRLKRLYR